MRSSTARTLKIYARAANKAGEGLATTIASILTTYASDQARATDLLLCEPDAYMNLKRYLESTSATLPHPLLSVELGSFLMPADEFLNNADRLPRWVDIDGQRFFVSSDAVRLPGLVDIKGQRFWKRTVADCLHTPARGALLDAALELESLCTITDAVFSEETMHPVDRKLWIDAIARRSGMQPFFVY